MIETRGIGRFLAVRNSDRGGRGFDDGYGTKARDSLLAKKVDD